MDAGGAHDHLGNASLSSFSLVRTPIAKWEAEMSREQQERREKWEQDPVRANALANHQAKSKAVDEVKCPH